MIEGLHAGGAPWSDGVARIVSVVRSTLAEGLAATGGVGLPASLSPGGSSPRPPMDVEATALALVTLRSCLSEVERDRMRSALAIPPGDDLAAPLGVLARVSPSILLPWTRPAFRLHTAMRDGGRTAIPKAEDRSRARLGSHPGSALERALALRGNHELLVGAGDPALNAAFDREVDDLLAHDPAPGRLDELMAVAVAVTLAVRRGRGEAALRRAPLLARSLRPGGTLDPSLGPDATRTVPVLLVLEGLLHAGIGPAEGVRTLSTRGGAASSASSRAWVPRVAWTDDGLTRPDESGSLTALRGLDEVGEVDLMVATETSPPMVTLLEGVMEAADVVVDRWLGCSLDTADLFWRTVTRARRPVVIVLTPDHLRDPSWGRARMRTPGLLRHAVERATLVVAPGRHLAQWAVEAGAADVMLIPPAAELTAAPAPLGPWRGRIAVPGADAPRADQERLANVIASVDERVELGPITWVVLGPLPAELREHPRVEVRSASPVEIIEAAVDAAILPLDPGESPITRSLHPWRRLAGVGIPVAVTRGGGLDAIIRDQEDGLLVDPDGWGDAVARLRDPSLRQALAASARVRVAEQFSSERAARLWIRSLRIAREATPEASSMQGIL